MREPTTYSFQTLDNPGDPTFNQLLGINNDGLIAGFFGNGQPASRTCNLFPYP